MSNRPTVPKSPRGARSSRSGAGSGSNPLLIWMVVAVAALIVVAVGVALLASRDAQLVQTDKAQVSDVSIEGETLPPFDGTEPDPAMERRAPAFAATTFDDTEVSVLPGDGTAKVIGFFAHWCPHCQRELPRIAGWLAANELPVDVEVIAVSTSVDSGAGNYPPSAWFEEEQWPAVVVRDSAGNEIADAYGLRGFPYTVGIDAGGRVVARVAGELNDEAWEFLLEHVATASG